MDAADLDALVKDKRAAWRASGAKARRRQRRYNKLLIAHLPLEDDDGEDVFD